MQRVTLSIEGMSCGHCLARVKQALSGVESVRLEDARIGKIVVEFDPGRVSTSALERAVEQAGYSVVAVDRAA